MNINEYQSCVRISLKSYGRVLASEGCISHVTLSQYFIRIWVNVKWLRIIITEYISVGLDSAYLTKYKEFLPILKFDL